MRAGCGRGVGHQCSAVAGGPGIAAMAVRSRSGSGPGRPPQDGLDAGVGGGAGQGEGGLVHSRADGSDQRQMMSAES